MKIPNNNVYENIIQGHTKKKVTIKRDAAAVLYLRYILYMKTLANEADRIAFSQRRRKLEVRDIVEAEQIIGHASETAYARSRHRARRTPTASPSASRHQRNTDSEKENDLSE
ncbi:hypothetical protein SK128_026378 [Halocaridina rubra]|uniref:Uncharacterized protein n=1 Tax=Halocaridina rubra TaxID=373956 RepID=A0AAN8XGA8_HALRR